MDPNSTDPSSTPGLEPGQSPPLAALTPTNQSGVVIIGTALALIFAVISSLLRLFIRMEFRQKFGQDDFASFASLTFFAIQSSVVFVQVSRGFGKTVDDIRPADMVRWQKDAYSSELFYILTMWLTKSSVLLLLLRLSPDKKHNLMCKVVLAASTALMVVSIFVVALRCTLSQPWIFVDQQCTGLLARWQVNTAFDVTTEAAIFAISVFMIQGIQLSYWKKFVVVLAFALRLPVIVPSILRLHYLSIEFSSSDPSLDGVLASACMQIELSYAIIATTTPCLRPFMSALNTHYGGPKEAKTSSPSGSKATAKSGQEYSLDSLSTASRLAREEKKKKKDTSIPQTRWDNTEYNVNIMSADQSSLQSNDSKKMIISKNTEWTVDYEDTQDARGPGRAV